VLFYGKMTPSRDNVILAAVNLDPFASHAATLAIPLEEIGIPAGETYELHELLTDGRRLAHESTLAVELDPQTSPAHIYRVSRWSRREQDFPYFR
jgi:starch synthase (maltosyl-transferring)